MALSYIFQLTVEMDETLHKKRNMTISITFFLKTL
jgi:hypothetical protein